MGLIQVLMIDPPWPKNKGGSRKVRPNQTGTLDYATMSVPDIFKLLDESVFPQAAETHTVFMWTVDQFIHQCESAMKERGYKLHARMIWDKGNGVAPAFTIRYTHEYLLWFYKPKMLPIPTNMRGKLGTVFRGKQREHSRKPDEAYTMVASLYPEAVKMDVFSRETRPGWQAWGNEVGKFDGHN